MKFAAILSFGLLLNACQSQFDSSQLVTETANCPTPQKVYLTQPSTQEGFFERFNYQVRNIVADADTIKFQTLNQDFVYCRSNGEWSVQSGTPVEFQPPKNYEETIKKIVNPEFESITLAGKTYQYRVVLEPQFTLDADNNLTRSEVSPASDRVVLELITPDSPQPQRQTLYTLQQLQQLEVKNGYSGVGTRLGIPEITAAVTHGDRIWWSVAFEQGEGNNGMATIVGYQPETNSFTLIQPQRLSSQQITDLVVTGDTNHPTFWFGTKFSGEGNPNIPASGLVAYRANLENPNASTSTSYTVHNSPLVGAIPYKLRLENDTLWVAAGNGVCQLNLQTVDNLNWSCWRFALMAESAQLPLYTGLQETTPAVQLSPSENQTVEVLWWYPQDYEQRNGRYEIKYDQGFTVTLNQGASKEIQRFIPPGKPPIDWVGSQWHWNGTRFVRGWDEVARNEFGGGPRGIAASDSISDRPSNINALRGDLELLDLTSNTTTVRYYSGWVEQKLLNPYFTVVPQEKPQLQQPNPLLAVMQ